MNDKPEIFPARSVNRIADKKAELLTHRQEASSVSVGRIVAVPGFLLSSAKING